MNDLYAVLGVSTTAGHTELRRAWRRLALRWHPDRAGDGATTTFQKLQAAYAVLSDPVSRAAYDRRQSAAASIARGRTPGVMLSRVSGPLAGLLAVGIARRAADGIIELYLTSDEAAAGGMVTIPMRVRMRDGDALFTAWLAIPPGVQDGEIALAPPMAGMIERVRFRLRVDRAVA